jgi:two-component system, NtrC family, sensor kinase
MSGTVAGPEGTTGQSTYVPGTAGSGARVHAPARSSGGRLQPLKVRERLQQPVSLRIEMLLSLAVIGTAALMIAIINVLLFDDLVASPNGAIYISLLILADVAVFVLFGASKLNSLVVRPLENVAQAAQAIAAGDLSRRVPQGNSSEFLRLASAINHMTVRLLEEQAHVARMEKMAGVGRLAAGVAHEIGNPLGAIHGYTHLLRKAVPDAPPVQEALEGLEREAERIDRIMRGMLEYARPRQRSLTTVDVNGCVHRVVSMLSDQGALHGVEVHLTLAPSLPLLAGDRHEMEQVFVNLLLNSVDAMHGSGSISVVARHLPFEEFARGEGVRRANDPNHLAVQREPNPRLRTWLNHSGEPEEVLQVVVADSGPGVPPSESERIFDPFYTSKDPGKGTGLGLAIVSRIIDSMSGAVWVRPAREGGAAFVMLFAVESGVGDGGEGE